MIAAEQWYEQQANYQKYGFDMKPERPRRKNIRTVKRHRMTVKGRARTLFATVVTGALFIVIIIANAYAVAVNYNINGIIEKNNSLRGDIEVISVEINSAKNIQNIEKKAMSELGMVAPAADKCIYAEGSGKSKKKTAMAQNPDN